ncbi:hypothetical protein Q3H58_002962 [Pseudomonas psychrotolerans]|nr:hypothetical protein [Pseudomonas psychrotolerans]
MTAPQHQLIGQAQRVIPVQAQPPLLFAGAALTVIVARQRGTPGLARGVLDLDIAATDRLARYQVHLHLVGRQAVELVDHLLQLAQVEQLARRTGKGLHQLAGRQATARRGLEAFQLALHHQDGKDALGEILLRQVGPTGDVATPYVVIGDGFEQRVELVHTQALADIGLCQGCLVLSGEMLGALELNVLDGEAAPFGGGRRGRRLNGCPWQLLEILQALLLLLKQALLPIADQVGIAGIGGDHLGLGTGQAEHQAKA